MKHKIYGVCILTAFFFIAGCGEVETPPTVVVNTETEALSYSFSTVLYDTVVCTKKVECKYQQTKEQEISFSETGRYVDAVYVREGDSVKKGTLLCELSSESLESEIERLEYNITRNNLMLSYLDEKENIDIQYAWINSNGNSEAAKESVKNIQESYDKQRVSYEDSLEFDNLELSEKKKLLSGSRLYASMDGVVYDLDDDLLGSTSKKGEVIMTIVDNDNGIFVSALDEYEGLFTQGETYDLSVSLGTSTGLFEITPLNMDKWEKGYQAFSIVLAPENASLEVGNIGSVSLVTDSKENVLTLPKSVVHEADGEKYVYIVDEDNMREVKWIKTGLEGDDLIEIVSGLSEGDEVVRK